MCRLNLAFPLHQSNQVTHTPAYKQQLKARGKAVLSRPCGPRDVVREGFSRHNVYVGWVLECFSHWKGWSLGIEKATRLQNTVNIVNQIEKRKTNTSLVPFPSRNMFKKVESCHQLYALVPGWNRSHRQVRCPDVVQDTILKIYPHDLVDTKLVSWTRPTAKIEGRLHLSQRHLPTDSPVQYGCREARQSST